MQSSACISWHGEEDPLRDSSQVLAVTTEDWPSVRGILQRYERAIPGEEWTPVGAPIPVVVGRNGMAWGRGLYPIPPNATLIKKEGDGKSPAGIFGFSHAFGLQPIDQYPDLKIPYFQITSDIECIDDLHSAYYNQIINTTQVVKDWSSSEKMVEFRQEYRLGLVVEHNAEPIEKGGGSCIFFHLWRDPESGTSGCTAMSEDDFVELLHWIDSAKNPRLVQCPQSELERYAKKWGWPGVSRG